MRTPSIARRLLVAAGGIVLAGAFACGEEAAAPCVPGRTVACTCAGGGQGLQTCAADGSGFDACAFCGEPRSGFTDVTKELGLPDSAGPCLGFEDFDGDGHLDLLLATQAGAPGSSSLLLYPGTGHAFAKPVALGASLMTLCAAGDVDRDGKPDIVLVSMGVSAGLTEVQYLHNLGGLKFERGAVDVPGIGEPQVWAMGLWDYDNDGWLDIFVGHNLGSPFVDIKDCYFKSDADFGCYAEMIAHNTAPLVWRNDHGAFKPVPGILASPYPGTVNAVAFADINRDGRTDVFMSNDFYVDHLHLQTAPGKYQHGEHFCGIDEYNHGMGAAIADYDGDGLYDIYGADLGPNNLWYGTPTSTSMPNRALALGISAATRRHSNWAPLGEDFDLDGRPDIFVASAGVVETDADVPRLGLLRPLKNPAYPQNDLVFWNENGTGFYAQKLPHRPGQTPTVAMAASAAGDFDGDGDLDIAVGGGTPYQFRLLRNEQPKGNWLVVDLDGTSSNRDGLGAEVSLLEDGKLWQIRTVGTQGSIGSSWRRAHFGLGDRTTIPEVHVRWPSGKTQSVTAVTANQTLKLSEP